MRCTTSATMSHTNCTIRSTQPSSTENTCQKTRCTDVNGNRKSILSDQGSHSNDVSARRKVVGLSNLGNTCFYNSVMQNLMNLDLLAKFFLHTRTHNVPKEGRLTSELGRMMTNSRTNPSSVTPRGVLSEIVRHAPRFKGRNQHDAHELLRCLLDAVHEEEIKRHKKSLPQCVVQTKEQNREHSKEVQSSQHGGTRVEPSNMHKNTQQHSDNTIEKQNDMQVQGQTWYTNTHSVEEKFKDQTQGTNMQNIVSKLEAFQMSPTKLTTSSIDLSTDSLIDFSSSKYTDCKQHSCDPSSYNQQSGDESLCDPSSVTQRSSDQSSCTQHSQDCDQSSDTKSYNVSQSIQHNTTHFDDICGTADQINPEDKRNKRAPTFIEEIFSFKFCSMITCQSCSSSYITFDPCFDLSLPISSCKNNRASSAAMRKKIDSMIVRPKSGKNRTKLVEKQKAKAREIASLQHQVKTTQSLNDNHPKFRQQGINNKITSKQTASSTTVRQPKMPDKQWLDTAQKRTIVSWLIDNAPLEWLNETQLLSRDLKQSAKTHSRHELIGFVKDSVQFANKQQEEQTHGEVVNGKGQVEMNHEDTELHSISRQDNVLHVPTESLHENTQDNMATSSELTNTHILENGIEAKENPLDESQNMQQNQIKHIQYVKIDKKYWAPQPCLLPGMSHDDVTWICDTRLNTQNNITQLQLPQKSVNTSSQKASMSTTEHQTKLYRGSAPGTIIDPETVEACLVAFELPEMLRVSDSNGYRCKCCGEKLNETLRDKFVTMFNTLEETEQTQLQQSKDIQYFLQQKASWDDQNLSAALEFIKSLRHNSDDDDEIVMHDDKKDGKEKKDSTFVQMQAILEKVLHVQKVGGILSDATKRMMVSDPPEILTIHLNRFKRRARSFCKQNAPVHFPLHLDVSRFCVRKDGEIDPTRDTVATWEQDGYEVLGNVLHNDVNTDEHTVHVNNVLAPIEYELQGIVCHSGGLSGGHYVAYVHTYDGWYCISDSHVSHVKEEKVLQAQAYMLFYKRVRNKL